MLIRARHYSTGQPTDVEYVDGTVVRLSSFGSGPANREAGWIAPALFDLQINGCLGISFNSLALTREQVRTVVDECRRHGLGGLVPTVITGSFEAIAHGLATLGRSCESDPVIGTSVPGFHLEGPYISPDVGPRRRS